MKLLALGLLAIGLAGCRDAGAASSATATVSPTTAPASSSSAVSSIALPPTSTATPSPIPRPLATPVPVPRPVIAPALSRGFAVLPFGGSQVSGVIAIQSGVGFDTATVSLRGLAASGLHAIHVHLGSCANPYAGVHLTVLGFLGATSAGTGTLQAAIAPGYLSAGHYVIVYASTAPQRIVGCANLAPL